MEVPEASRQRPIATLIVTSQKKKVKHFFPKKM